MSIYQTTHRHPDYYIYNRVILSKSANYFLKKNLQPIVFFHNFAVCSKTNLLTKKLFVMDAYYIALEIFLFLCFVIMILCIIGVVASILFCIIKRKYKDALYLFATLIGGIFLIFFTKQIETFKNCVNTLAEIFF